MLLASASYTWLRVMSIVCNRETPAIENFSQPIKDAHILQCIQEQQCRTKHTWQHNKHWLAWLTVCRKHGHPSTRTATLGEHKMIFRLVSKHQTCCNNSQPLRTGKVFAKESTAYRIYSDSLARVCSDLQWETPFVPELALEGGMGPEGNLPCRPYPSQGTQHKLVGHL